MKRFIFGDQIDIFDLMYSPYKIKKPIRLIELFAGIGAQAAALRNIGANFERYRVVEFDKYAIASYNAIHGTDFPVLDVTQIHGADLGIVDTDKFEYLLTYSFPCTDLSICGRMQGMDEGSGTRSSLLWEVRRLLDECDNLPQCLLMENVPQVHSEDNMPNFRKWLKYLEVKGYTSYWQDLNAKDYGVAQSRNRTFVVSFLGNGTYKFPEKIPLKNTMADHLEDQVDEKYYLTNPKAKILIDNLIANGKILTDRQTDRQLTCQQITRKQQEKRIASPHACRQVESSTTRDQEMELLKSPEIQVIGMMDNSIDNTREQTNRIYGRDGLAPTIPTAAGGGHIPKVLEVDER